MLRIPRPLKWCSKSGEHKSIQRELNIPQDQGGTYEQDHQVRELIEHKQQLVSLHYIGILHTEEESHGICQTAH